MKGETQIMADEAFQNAVQSYHDVFLKSDRVQKMVASGACSQHDFREVFRNNIEKRVRSLPEIDGLSKETVLTSWMAKFDCILKGSGKKSAANNDEESINWLLIRWRRTQTANPYAATQQRKHFNQGTAFRHVPTDSEREEVRASDSVQRFDGEIESFCLRSFATGVDVFH